MTEEEHTPKSRQCKIATDPWEGYRPYQPERPRGWYERDLPDRFTIDKPGKCEVRCEYDGRGRYKCREYRC